MPISSLLRSSIAISALALSLALTSRSSLAAPANPEAPDHYALVKATNVGRAMMTTKGKAKSVATAIEAVFNDLDDYFDDDYEVSNAYEDGRDHRLGMASFSAKYRGKDVRGVVYATLRENDTVLAVVFCTKEATQADWAELVNVKAPAGEAAAADDVKARDAAMQEKAAREKAAAQNGTVAEKPAPDAKAADVRAGAAPEPVKLREYRFPDNSGLIGLAPGWQTNAQSCLQGLQIEGPADQKVTLGLGLAVNTPDSQAVALARQYGTGGIPMFVAPYCAPADALPALMPQFSRLAQSKGLPAAEIDHVALVQELPPVLQGGKFAVVSYGITKTIKGESKHYQCVAQISTTPIAPGSWSLWMSEIAAPDATAKQDLPAMAAMLNSWRTNDQLVAAKTQEWVAASNQRFDAMQKAHKDLTDTYDRNNAAWRANQTTQSRAMDNFSEAMRGVRTVEDTTTGEKSSVDLGNVDQIVTRLNEAEPGRYKQIPLRDELDPQGKKR